MSGLSKNLTLVLFLIFILSLRGVIAGDCRPQDSLLLSGRVFCAVQLELWMTGATVSSEHMQKAMHVTKTADNYPEELTRPLERALWPLMNYGIDHRSIDKMY